MSTKPYIGLLLVVFWCPIVFGVDRLKVKVTDVKNSSILVVSGLKLTNCVTNVNQTLHRASSSTSVVPY